MGVLQVARIRKLFIRGNYFAVQFLFLTNMSFWDALTGRKPSSNSSSSTQSETLQDRASSTQSPVYNPSAADDVSSFLSGSSLLDPSQLHPLAGLDQQTLDYLSLDESALSDLPGSQSALPSRGWSDDLCYGTGVTYLTALTAGGAWGLVEGLNRSPSNAPPKLRLNSVLNSVTRRGPFLGNSAGVIALVYNGVNSTIGYYRGKHDSANSIAAGAFSGMLFKSTRGLRPMMISGGLVAATAGAWAVSLRNCSAGFFRMILTLVNRSLGKHFSSPLGDKRLTLQPLPSATLLSMRMRQDLSNTRLQCYAIFSVFY